MNTCVLAIKQQVNKDGLFYKAIVNVKGEMIMCILNSNLRRGELLKRLATISSLSDIYSIDKKAVMLEI